MGEGSLRQRLAGEGLEPSSWENGPHHHYAEHRHEYHKILVAMAGSVTFHLPELQRDVVLDAGDRLELPAGTLHGADVGAGGVTCLEAQVVAGVPGAELRHRVGWAGSP